MVFIREYDENINLLEFKTCEKRCKMWNHYLANSKQRNGRVDWKIIELWMLMSYDNSSSSSNCGDICDNDIMFLSSFLRQIRSLMETKNTTHSSGRVKTN